MPQNLVSRLCITAHSIETSITVGIAVSRLCPAAHPHYTQYMQVVKDHIKLTMTGPAAAVEEGKSPEELQDSYVTVLVARHFEAMWAHMRHGLEALPAPHHRLMDQVSCPLPSCCQLH